jgi:Ran GTPase-activating protein (RanGAP) involved in mRNA processing and transport
MMGIGSSSFQLLIAECMAGPLHKQLRDLDAGWNHLDDDAMEYLRASWPENLDSLCLRWNSISCDGAAHLAVSLASQSAAALRSLDLRSNPLSDKGVYAICEAAAQRTGLRDLGLGETMLTDDGARAALPLLMGHPTLEILDIGENLLTDVACGSIAAVVSSALALRVLLLRGFLFEPKRVGDAGGRIVVDAVTQRRSDLRFDLDMDYQQVGCDTALEISRNCDAWSRISLFNTDVSTMGAMSLANALRQHKTAASRIKLNIAQCRIGEGAVKMLRNVGLARLDSHGQRGQHRI